VATKVAQVPEDARPPDREPGAVGVVVHAERIPLPPDDAEDMPPDPGVDILEEHFARLAGRRWGGFAAPLRAALEAEAREDEAHPAADRGVQEAALSHGGEEDVAPEGVAADALRAWTTANDRGARRSGRHAPAGVLSIPIQRRHDDHRRRTWTDPPRTGFVRARDARS
jgi:hypothetical protein